MQGELTHLREPLAGGVGRRIRAEAECPRSGCRETAARNGRTLTWLFMDSRSISKVCRVRLSSVSVFSAFLLSADLVVTIVVLDSICKVGRVSQDLPSVLGSLPPRLAASLSSCIPAGTSTCPVPRGSSGPAPHTGHGCLP